jgi:NADH-quinone oxidoreductase subunit M
MYKRVIFGAVASPAVEGLEDLNKREILILAVLAAAVLWMGLYPLPVTEVMHATVEDLLAHIGRSKL